MVFLHHKWHVVFLKPLSGLLRTELLEEPLHELMTTRIDLFQVSDGLERVCEVAPSASSYFHFGEHFCASLKDGDLCKWLFVLSSNGSKKTGCASTDDGYM